MEDGQQPLSAEATSSTLESPQALPDNEQNRNAGTVSAAAFQNLNRTVAHVSEGGLTLGEARGRIQDIIRLDGSQRGITYTQSELETNASPWIKLLDSYQQTLGEENGSGPTAANERGPPPERPDADQRGTPQQQPDARRETLDPNRQAPSDSQGQTNATRGRGSSNSTRGFSAGDRPELDSNRGSGDSVHASERSQKLHHRKHVKRQHPDDSDDESSSSLSDSDGSTSGRSSDGSERHKKKKKSKPRLDPKLLRFRSTGRSLPRRLNKLDARARNCAQFENFSRDPKEVVRLIRAQPGSPPVSPEALTAIIKNEFYEFDTLLREKGESETVTTEGDWVSAWDLWSQAVSFVFWDRNDELRGYFNYMRGHFRQHHQGMHRNVVALDKAIRRELSLSTSSLYSDLHNFTSLERSYLYPGGRHYQAPSSSFPTTGQFRKRARISRDSTGEICWNWNWNRCYKSDKECPRRHICSECNSPSHRKGNRDCPRSAKAS
jgi:hypothetical protein